MHVDITLRDGGNYNVNDNNLYDEKIFLVFSGIKY